jgi:hypothetical protein
VNEPKIKETLKGFSVVGGNDTGGLLMLCIQVMSEIGLVDAKGSPTISTFPLPSLPTFTGWIPSSPDFSSTIRKNAWCGRTGFPSSPNTVKDTLRFSVFPTVTVVNGASSSILTL